MTKVLWEKALRFKIWRDAQGQDMVEYALMVSFVTVAVAATFPPVGNEISTIFSKLSSSMEQAKNL